MNLYELLYKNKERLKIHLVLAHVNHGQRPESDLEESELRTLADRRETRIHVAHYSVILQKQKLSTFRYDFLNRLWRKRIAPALVTGHHANDQAETTFMRLIRGTKLRHLSGIPVRQPFGKGGVNPSFVNFYQR